MGSNEGLPSTTWGWKQVKIRRPAGGQEAQVAEGDASGRPASRSARRWRHLPGWDRRRRLYVSIKYRGGGECWYEVEARGSRGRFHGATALHDAVREIMGGAEADKL